MLGSSRSTEASVADYDLRQASADRWQLMEPLPVSRNALEAELRRLDAKLSSLEDESDAELLLGCELLSQRKQQQEEQSYARFDRANASLAMLFAHECDQVNARYAERCEQLKQDMSEELQREIRRLKYTRDGVSVMDRRRLMRRSVGGAGSNSATASASTSMGMTSSSQGGGEDASSQDPYYSAVSTTAAQLAEKKRMDVLLSATPIFQRLNKTLGDEQVSRDLEMIKETMPSLVMDGDGDPAGDEDDEEQETREMEAVRKQLSPGSGVFKRRRLAYDPRHIPEGQAVVVYKKTPGSARKKPQKAKKQQQEVDDDDVSLSPTDKKVAAGVVTAKTATQLFLLTDSGVFETVDLSDWKSGRVSLHTAEC